MSYTINTDNTGTGTTTPSWHNYCSWRLPCGLCRQTNTVCPYYTNSIEITCGQDHLPYTINYCEDKQ